MASERMYFWNFVGVVLSSLLCLTYSKYPELKLSNELINLDFDNITNDIFIGGKNVLLKVSPALAELKRISTGPQLDYIDCLSKGECDGQLTDNWNKILLVDNPRRHLITCGSLRHGVCHLRSLDSLLNETNSDEYVVSNYVRLPAVAMITPFGNQHQGKHALYVATSWDEKYKNSGPLNFGVRPAVSTRKIDSADVFQLSHNDLQALSFLKFKDFTYLVKYIYGFSSGNFNYFVTVQETTESFRNKNRGGPKVLKTFIIRLCQQDIQYWTYVELPVECQSSNGTNFNIAQSAYLTKPGGYLSKSLGLQAWDDVLVVAFFESTSGWDGPSQNSAICMYPVKEINKAVASDQQKCVDGTYNEKETLGLPWLDGGDKDCAKKMVSTPWSVSVNFLFSCIPSLPVSCAFKLRPYLVGVQNFSINKMPTCILSGIYAGCCGLIYYH